MGLIIGGNPNGQFSGKVGGLVYAHNRCGQIVRMYRSGINANTNAQIAARNRFAAAASSFHSLTPAQKSAWGDFACSIFNPKNNVNNCIMTGFNAYTALRTVTQGGQQLNFAYTMTKNGAALTGANTPDPFAFNNTPPVFALQANIADATGSINYHVTLDDVTVNDDASFEITVGVNSGGPPATVLGDFVDGAGNEFGFLVQMSNSNPQGGLFYQNPYKYTLGYLQKPSLTAPDLTGALTYEFAVASGIDPGDYQDFPIAGDYVRVTLYMASVTGMLIRVGALETEIQ